MRQKFQLFSLKVSFFKRRDFFIVYREAYSTSKRGPVIFVHVTLVPVSSFGF